MNEKQILNKIAVIRVERDKAIQKFNELYRDKPFGYKLRAACVKNQVHRLSGEIEAWEARLRTR